MRNKRKKYLSMLLVFLLLVSTMNIPVSATGMSAANHIIISQVYGGGGNSGALCQYDFIELYNPTDEAVALSGWSVQYGSSGGNSYSNITELSGSISPGEYYLIQEAKGSSTIDIPFPTPNVIGTINMAAGSGKVALVSKPTAITSKSDSAVVDFVGYGTANEFEGTKAAPTLSSTLVAVRKVEGVDTDDNGADFEDKAPNPRSGLVVDTETKCKAPTASIASGSAVPTGTEVTFASSTKDAVLEYNLLSETAISWTTGSMITITTDSTYYVRATKEDLEDSDVATFSYTIGETDPEAQLVLSVSPKEGNVTPDTDVTITCNDKNAFIYYTLDESNPTSQSNVYSSPIKISGSIGDTVTLKAIAKSDGKPDSEVLTVHYTIKDPNEFLTIKEVLALTSGTKDVVVTGQIVYFATSYSNPVIQSVIDGETYALYVYGTVPTGAKVGDLVKLTGTYTVYNGLPELTSIIKSEIISSEKPMEAQTVTIAELKSDGLKMLGQFVKIEKVKLGAYSASGSTTVTDETGSISIYKATPYPTLVEAGDVVDLYAMVACYNATVQLYVGTKDVNGFNIYDIVNDTKAPVITLPESYLEAKTNQDYTISIGVSDNKGIQEVTLSYTIGENTVNQKMAVNESTGKYEYIIPGNEILTSAANIKFSVKAVDVTGLETVSALQTITINNAPQVTAVSPARNSSTGENKSPVISVTLQNAGITPQVTLTLKKGNTTIIENQEMSKALGKESDEKDSMTSVEDPEADKVPSEPATVYSYATKTLEDGNYNAAVTIIREDSQSITATWSFTVGTAQYQAYFGQFHAHTAQYSDGSGTLADGLNYLKNIPKNDNVDFISFTDHSNYFDTTSASNPVEALNDKTKMTAESLALWNTYVSDMETFNENNAGSLLTLPGFEMTWSGGPGHINTFNSDGLVSRNNQTLNNKSADAGLKAYYETLILNSDPLANLSQFNHPGKTFGTFSDFAYWSPAYDEKMVAVEVGNGEGAIGSGGYFPSYAEYTKALDKGWHVAPTNNQDNHKGRWGNSNTARTVVITDDFSKNGLLTGVKNMSVYSTEDKNLNIQYSINDVMMGSIISEVPEEALKFNIKIDDEDEDDIISKVEIITNSGRIAASETFDSNAVDWSFELPTNQGYYYVRVTQADKNIAITAPIWVGQEPLVGISSLETDTKMPVTGEALTFTTTFFNNEKETVSLKTVEYVQDNIVLTAEDVNTEIVSNATLKHTLEYIPTTSGSTKITVKAILLIGGQEKTFTMDLNLEVRDNEKLVYVGIDASHYNEYVNGNYKDSMGNFANMAVEYDVRVVELSTSEELIAAAQNPKFKMLVLTPPTRRNGSAILIGYENYSSEVIAAIKEFAESGKTLIITSWGDYYEGYNKYSDGTPYTLPASDQMSAQQNRLLEAIGSSLRVSDDEIKDDVKNGGQPQRLYLENYNLSNSFLKGIKPSEQVYSNYGGSTVYAVGADSLPTNTLTSTISPMVYAFDTSYSSDDDGDGTTGIEGILVPKYEGKYMVAASETMDHENGLSSTVIVAGSAFMSNFEIQAEMDNYSTPAYSNYTILENIVKQLNEVTVSNIEEVQAADEGKTFTIRGIVTSNASGYDKNTAFFDCIYVQDATAGINAFPVAGNIQAGQTVEIIGKTSSYNGERQIAVAKVTVIDETIKPLPTPISLTTAKAASGSKLGSLVKVEGTVVSIETSNNVVESIYIKDSSNVQCRVFIDGYITSDKAIAKLKVGAKLTATGLSSIDTVGTRIRIRNRADVICKSANTNSDNEGEGNDNNNSNPDLIKENPIANNSQQHVLSETVVKDLIAQVKKAEGKNPVIEINIDKIADKKDIEVVLSKASINEIATATEAKVKINTGLGSITFSQEAIKKINEQADDEKISIGIALNDDKKFSSEMQEVIGDRPVYEFSVTAGSKEVTSFGKDGVQVSLPYTLKEGEDVNSILIYYIDASDNYQIIRSNYNQATKTVDFVTSHFSTCAIGYNKKTFEDVKKSDWYYSAVSYLTAREISTGTAEKTFSPDMSLTRGQFIVLIMNAYNIKPDENSTTNFVDAGHTYYTQYLGVAKRLGITNGIGNNLFEPNRVISRQDMVALLYNVLKQVNELPQTETHKNLDDFKDFASVSAYAKDSMKVLVEGGYISGNNGMLNPKGTATRAEMAQILYNLLIIK